jgi:D-alanyl-D-alanine carboxypeptidase
MSFFRFIVFVFIISCVTAIPVRDVYANPKYASIVVDAETGKVLRARNADKKLYPASITKIMTLYMAFDALKSGKIRLNDRIRISKRAAGMEPSKIGLPAGSSIKVEDAIYALVTKSANDIAVAMAEHLGGTEWGFASQMTSKARALGMKDTTFKNASGLPDNAQKSTAKDLAIMARALIYNHPQYYHYFSTKNFKYRGVNYNNHNRLMSSYKGMDGIKTGYIHASGFNLVASAVQDNRRLIGVVLGGRTTASRNSHMAKILDEGFAMAKSLPKTRVAQKYQPYARVPTPQSKPDDGESVGEVVVASLSNTSSTPSPTMRQQMEKVIDEVLGQGDVDPRATRRLETGLMAIAAHTGRVTEMQGVGEYGHNAKAAGSAVMNMAKKWSIQIGAYSSQPISDQAIQVAAKSLPPELRSDIFGTTMPLTTGSRTIYRARIGGFDEHSAQRACAYIRNCMVIAP